MKKLMIGAMALGLFLAAPAVMTAQAAGPGHTERHHAAHQRAQGQERGMGREHRASGQQRAVYRERATQHRATFVARERRGIRSANRATMRANYATQRAHYATRRAHNATQRANYATRRANRATNRADFAVYRANVRAQHRYHWNNYQRPHGWYAHRWTYGERLPVMFYSSNYWIGDYISFGLMAPPSGLVWVRYGDDALLINRYNGEVVRVVYDVFY